MAYVKTVWTNEIANGLPLRYKITNFDDTVIAEGATIEMLNNPVPGTPVNATNLNKLETGLEAAAAVADTGVAAAAAAQGTANLANSAATTAQATANTGVANAATAQSSASSAAAAAAAAQGTANTAITAAATAQTTANTGVTNAATAQATANSALAKAAHNLSMVDLASEVSAAGETAYADALTATVTLTATGRIRVRAYGRMRGSALYSSPAARLVIDGTADAFLTGFQLGLDPADQSWRPFAAEWFRAGIGAGTRMVKLQFRNAYAEGSAYLAAGARLVVEVDYP